jgi:hypothetical protein
MPANTSLSASVTGSASSRPSNCSSSRTPTSAAEFAHCGIERIVLRFARDGFQFPQPNITGVLQVEAELVNLIIEGY